VLGGLHTRLCHTFLVCLCFNYNRFVLLLFALVVCCRNYSSAGNAVLHGLFVQGTVIMQMIDGHAVYMILSASLLNYISSKYYQYRSKFDKVLAKNTEVQFLS